MNYTAANNRLHAEIDKLRYDKLALKVASASVEKECKALMTESSEMERGIHQKHAQQEEVEHECNAIRSESDAKQVRTASDPLRSIKACQGCCEEARRVTPRLE